MGKITQERLKQVLNYNQNTGVFKRRVASGCVAPGSVAGSLRPDGYLETTVDGRKYRIHRLAWLYVYGYLPENGLDHIDRNPLNNKISNLREASHQCNARNCKSFKTNTSGIKGVWWDKAKNKWAAEMMVNYKKRFLGRYKNFYNAVCARLAGEQCVHWAGCDSDSPAYKYVKKNITDVITTPIF